MKSNILRLLPIVTYIVFMHDCVATETASSSALKKDGVAVSENINTIPRDTTIVGQKNAQSIFYGKQLLNETKRLLPTHVGASINCNSCHLSEGKKPDGLSYINTDRYPSYNARAGKVIDLADRVNGCFLRSMNGAILPKDSDEMKAIVNYMTWLSKGVSSAEKTKIKNLPHIDTRLKPNIEHGRQIYYSQCSACHGSEGEGKYDNHGKVLFPPLWGEHSFNIGAGMARTYTAAAFIYRNMPIGVNTKHSLGEGGTLSEQDAVDVAGFFTHMPRPDFKDKIKDWPKDKNLLMPGINTAYLVRSIFPALQ